VTNQKRSDLELIAALRWFQITYVSCSAMSPLVLWLKMWLFCAPVGYGEELLFFPRYRRQKTDHRIQKPQMRLACESWSGSERFAEAVAGGIGESAAVAAAAVATVDLCSQGLGSTCSDLELGPDRKRNATASKKMSKHFWNPIALIQMPQ